MAAIRPRLLTFLAAAFALSLLALARPPAARAHAFLVRSIPDAGARLANAPSALSLFFSEPFVGGSERITIRREGGDLLTLARPSSNGTVVRQPLSSKLKGIFVVHWRVLSDDGHLSVGEFAFAVRSNAALPSLKASTAKTSWSQVAASWLVFVGLALALGGLASERFVWQRTPLSARGVRAAPAGPGVGLASVGVFLQLVLLAGDRRAGDFWAGLNPSALADALASRPGKLTLALLGSVLVAGALLPLRWLRVAAILPLLAAAGLIAARGHSGTSGHSWAVLVDTIHLAAVAVWLGALAHLVLVVAREGATRSILVEGAGRYARLALPTVALIVATGVLTAIPEFRSVSAVVTSGYGRILLIKAVLIAVALVLALVARRRALPANPHPRLPLLERLTAAEATVLSAVLIVVAVLVNLAPPRGPAAAAAPGAELGPPPLAGPAVRLADLAGQLVVGLAATERELQFTIIKPGGEPAAGATLEAEAERPGAAGADLFPRPCGPGCFTIRFRLRSGRTTLLTRVSALGWTGGTARFNVPWPLPRSQPALLRRVARTMAAVPVIDLLEKVSSGPGSVSRPFRFRLSGRALMASELYRSGAVDVRSLSRTGAPTELAFALPASTIWYRMTIDASNRVRRETIVSPGHLIHRTFSYPAVAPGAARAARSSGAPRPPAGPLVLAREADDLAVGLAARPAGDLLALTATVLDGDGSGVAGLNLAVRVRSSRGTAFAVATSCGPGCYRASPPIEGKPQLALVRLERLGRTPAILRFPLPSHWPPRSAAALARRATRVFRGLRTLVIHERLASSATNVVRTTWRIEAPDRLAYLIAGGPQGVIIGGRRWDRDSAGARWQVSRVSPLSQPAPVWGSPPARASLLGGGRVAGRPVWIVSFLEPGVPAWFTLAIDKKTFRTLDLRMVAPAHFMHHRYGDFNRPLAIRAPG